MKYHQPLTAHFSPDSIGLADRFAAMLLAELASADLSKGLHILDLCCGCGVVGLEAERRLKNRAALLAASGQLRSQIMSRAGVRRQWTFLDVQDAYRPFFDLNQAEFYREMAAVEVTQIWKTLSFCELINQTDYQGAYDWIVSNPPYFEPDQGPLPPDELKARSRFFLDGSFEELLQAIKWALAPSTGRALILVRDLGAHGIGRTEILRRVFPEDIFTLTWLEPVRGTNLLLIGFL
jgi:tRNA1(Val) A37 N6-methylase TrmN6